MEGKSVQDVASEANANDTIPDEFIRPEHEQPGITTYTGDLPEVPVIDFSITDEEKLVNLIFDASCKWGFFQIVNHAIPNDVISKLQDVGKRFFELPKEDKEVYAKPPGSTIVEGYGTKLQKEVDGKKGWVDHLFHKLSPPSAINYQFWPKNPPEFREANEEYTKYLKEVEKKLLKCLSKGIGLEENELRDACGGDEMVYLMKINYYPPCPRPDLALGVPPHTDMSAITILVPNEVQGLQVFQDEHWIDVKYIPNALIIHIGDQTQILSNGKYKSVLHRTTVNKEKARLSWPVFMEPPLDKEVGPHPKLVTADNPAKYKTKKFSDYCHCKINKLPQ